MNITKEVLMRIIITALLALVVSAPAFAQGYHPERPVAVVDYDVFDQGYRAPARAGFVWVSGFYADTGQWVPGYYQPVRTRVNHSWVPGYWAGGRYVAGYWRVNNRAGQHWVRGYYQGRHWVSGYWAQGPRRSAVRYTRYRRPVSQPRYVGTYRRSANRGRVVRTNARPAYRGAARPAAQRGNRPAAVRTTTGSNRPAASSRGTNPSRPTASSRGTNPSRPAASSRGTNPSRPASNRGSGRNRNR